MTNVLLEKLKADCCIGQTTECTLNQTEKRRSHVKIGSALSSAKVNVSKWLYPVVTYSAALSQQI